MPALCSGLSLRSSPEHSASPSLYLVQQAATAGPELEVLLDEGISAFSFIYGIPSKQILDEFRRKGVVLIGTATTVDEATALEQAGVNVIAASGFEAGGHRGSFLQPSEDSLTGTMALVPQVVDAQHTWRLRGGRRGLMPQLTQHGRIAGQDTQLLR
jgi:NAD(P)H-dependent flavin oxidoreductase YrpB (nitropropane dioxygenase family)